MVSLYPSLPYRVWIWRSICRPRFWRPRTVGRAVCGKRCSRSSRRSTAAMMASGDCELHTTRTTSSSCSSAASAIPISARWLFPCSASGSAADDATTAPPPEACCLLSGGPSTSTRKRVRMDSPKPESTGFFKRTKHTASVSSHSASSTRMCAACSSASKTNTSSTSTAVGLSESLSGPWPGRGETVDRCKRFVMDSRAARRWYSPRWWILLRHSASTTAAAMGSSDVPSPSASSTTISALSRSCIFTIPKSDTCGRWGCDQCWGLFVGGVVRLCVRVGGGYGRRCDTHPSMSSSRPWFQRCVSTRWPSRNSCSSTKRWVSAKKWTTSSSSIMVVCVWGLGGE